VYQVTNVPMIGMIIIVTVCLNFFGFSPCVNFWCMTNVSGSLVCPIFRVLGKRVKRMPEVRNMCLYRSGVQWVVLNGRAN
jgi:hypothetical protein